MPMRLILLVLSMFVSTTGAAIAAVDPELSAADLSFELTEEELDTLAGDHPIVRVTRDKEGEAAALVFGSIEINAPQSVIWDIMVDCARAPELVPGLKSCAVIEDGPEGRWDIREHRVNFNALFSDVVNIFRSDYKEGEEIRFHLVGGDLKTQEGAWRLAPIEDGSGRTRVTYQARLAIGQPVPRFMIRRSIRKDMPRIFRALKEAAELSAVRVDVSRTP